MCGRMDERDVELIDRTTAYRAYFRVDRYRLRHRRFEGGMSRELAREVFERGQVVAVLPVDLTRRRVVLIEQFRAGAYAAGWSPWLIECVAGIVEPGETPEDVARREAQEEAGCELGALYRVMRYLSSPGATSETVTLFCGRVDSRGLGGVHGLASEGEDIRVEVVGFGAAFDLLAAGRITNAKTIIALQWLASHERTLAAAWSEGEGSR